MIKVFLTKAPFIKLVLPLILGIYLGKFCLDSLGMLFAICILLLTGFVVFYYWSGRLLKFRWFFLSGLLAMLFLVSIGCVLYGVRAPKSIDSNDELKLKVQIISKVGETQKNNKYEVFLRGTESDSLRAFENCKGLVYIPKDKFAAIYQAGQLLLVRGRLMPFVKNNIPYKFDYSRYLIHQRVVFRMLVYEAEKTTGPYASFNLLVLCAKIRSYYNKVLLENGIQEKQLAIVNAIFLGDKSQLSGEQKKAFSGAGAIHLLAVSGLHVGIIYLMLILVLKRLLGKRKVLIFIVILVLLWGYALLTGFSPSVLRASIMFMVLEVGRLMQRRVGIINLLAISMFLILWIEPLSIYSVGFWLSHSAVASIVLFYPYVNNFFYFSFPPFRWLWSIIALSVSAQIGAAPISILVFHEFPVLFIVANLLLIPIVAPVLVFCVLVMMFSFWPYLLRILISTLNDMLAYMNDVVRLIDSRSYSSVSSIGFEWWQMALLYLCLVLVLMFLDSKSVSALRRLGLVSLLFVFSLHLRHWMLPKEGMFAIELEQGLVVNCFGSDFNEVFLDHEISPSQFHYNLAGLWSHYGVKAKAQLYVHSPPNDSLITLKMFRDKTMLIVRKKVVWTTKASKHKVDFVALLNNATLTEEERNIMFPNAIVIQKGSNTGEFQSLLLN